MIEFVPGENPDLYRLERIYGNTDFIWADGEAKYYSPLYNAEYLRFKSLDDIETFFSNKKRFLMRTDKQKAGHFESTPTSITRLSKDVYALRYCYGSNDYDVVVYRAVQNPYIHYLNLWTPDKED